MALAMRRISESVAASCGVGLGFLGFLVVLGFLVRSLGFNSGSEFKAFSTLQNQEAPEKHCFMLSMDPGCNSGDIP